MLPGNAGTAAPDPAPEAAGGRRNSMQRSTGGDLVAAHPNNPSPPRNPKRRSQYDVRAALRRRTARRDMLIKLSMIAAALGALLCAAYSWLVQGG
jgi:hypothetical protein